MNQRRWAAALLAAVLVFALSCPALAADRKSVV